MYKLWGYLFRFCTASINFPWNDMAPEEDILFLFILAANIHWSVKIRFFFLVEFLLRKAYCLPEMKKKTKMIWNSKEYTYINLFWKFPFDEKTFFINSNYTKWVSFLSSQLFVYFFRPYNLRRKSALRPSQSFDTMKSTTSSVVSDGDTMEAAASTTSTKDQLDLASDFPPLMAAAPSIGEIEPPKWVTPAAFKSSNTQ